jgi:hypothetical protein
VSAENVCRYREPECDRVMGGITENGNFRYLCFTRYKITDSSNIIWEGQAAVWENIKCA